jgi:hypothetical protein
MSEQTKNKTVIHQNLKSQRLNWRLNLINPLLKQRKT